MSSSLDEALLVDYLAGRLPNEQRAMVECALDRSPRWLEVVAAIVRSDTRSTLTAGARLRPGQRVARYEVLELLGHGGMGTVYRAHDSLLKRSVALKVLRHSAIDTGALHRRLAHEAQLLARISHPHVVGIYEVGRCDELLFIAMEHLQGRPLERWLEERHRPWKEVLAVFTDAGEGLAATHDVGVVHRDFKPANVVVTSEERVVVIDFGLGRILTPPTETAGAPESESVNRASRSTSARAGTPLYMAPEQREGAVLSAACDQYAFCVALFAALYGTFPPGTLGAGRPYGSTARGTPPGQLLRVLERGLALDPSARWPSMRDLVEQLREMQRPRRRQLWLGGIAAFSLMGGLAFESTSIGVCEAGHAAMSRAWNPDLRQRLLTTADDPKLAAELRSIDLYVEAWQRQHDGACAAVGPMQRSRLRCLSQARRSVQRLSDVLAADAGHLAHTRAATEALPDLTVCERDAFSPLPEEPALRARAQALLDGLQDVDLLWRVQRHEQAKTDIARLVSEADAMQVPALQAEALLRLGRIHAETGELDDAVQALRAALELGQRSRHDHVVLHAYGELAYNLGYRQARHEEGLDLLRHAEVWSKRLEAAPRFIVHQLTTRGWIELDRRRTSAARAAFEEALAVIDRSPDIDGPDERQGYVQIGLASVAVLENELGTATSHGEKAVLLLERSLGPDHADTLQARSTLGVILREQGELGRAHEIFEHNLVLLREHFSDHPSIFMNLSNLATVELDRGAIRESAEHAAEALEVAQRIFGPNHFYVAHAYRTRGEARSLLDDKEGALEDFWRALDIDLAQFGAEHPSLGISHGNIAALLSQMGRHEEALEHHRKGLALIAAGYGDDAPQLAVAHIAYADTLVATGAKQAAVDSLRRAIELGQPLVVAEASFALARLLGGRHGRALAVNALSLYKERENSAMASEIERWLRT